jgi:hypothetical protein
MQRSVSTIHERAMPSSVKISRPAGIAVPLCDHHPFGLADFGSLDRRERGRHRGNILNAGGTPGEVQVSFQLVSPTSLHDRAKTMIEFEAEYDGKPLICSISRRLLEQLGNRDGASTEELLKLFEEHRPTIAAMVRKKYEVGVVDFVGKVVVTTADLNRRGVALT